MRYIFPKLNPWLVAIVGFLLPIGAIVWAFPPFPKAYWVYIVVRSVFAVSTWLGVVCVVEACRRYRKAESALAILRLAPVPIALIWPTISLLLVIRSFDHTPRMAFGG